MVVGQIHVKMTFITSVMVNVTARKEILMNKSDPYYKDLMAFRSLVKEMSGKEVDIRLTGAISATLRGKLSSALVKEDTIMLYLGESPHTATINIDLCCCGPLTDTSDEPERNVIQLQSDDGLITITERK